MDDPITQWLDDLKAQGPEKEQAAHKLWKQYFEHLVRVANGKLPQNLCRAFDPSDVAQSAFLSFFQGLEQGKFPYLEDRNNLWGLLVVITSRKASRYVARETTQKAGGGKVRGESAFQLPDEDDASRGIEAIFGTEPTPEMALQMSEDLARLLAQLPNDEYRRIAILKMEGYTIPEISQQIGFSPTTINERLRIIRDNWLQQGSDGAE